MTPTSTESYFAQDSVLRRVHREFAVAMSGPRALLMQATHPVAFAGFFAHTGALDDPYGRLERTARVMDTIAFGTRRQADRMTAHVRQMHARTHGELTEPAGRFPAGTPYAADDPVLLLWVLATLVDSALVAYQKYVGPLSRDERDAYWQDYKQIGRLFALRDEEMPGTIEDFEAYMADMLASGDLFVSEHARELAIQIIMHPPFPVVTRPLIELVNQTTVGLLPPEIRRLYGFRWDPVRGLAVGVGAEYLRRLVVPLLPSRLRLVPSARKASAPTAPVVTPG